VRRILVHHIRKDRDRDLPAVQEAALRSHRAIPHRREPRVHVLRDGSLHERHRGRLGHGAIELGARDPVAFEHLGWTRRLDVGDARRLVLAARDRDRKRQDE
jgi:hypothetical protein